VTRALALVIVFASAAWPVLGRAEVCRNQDWLPVPPPPNYEPHFCTTRNWVENERFNVSGVSKYFTGTRDMAEYMLHDISDAKAGMSHEAFIAYVEKLAAKVGAKRVSEPGQTTVFSRSTPQGTVWYFAYELSRGTPPYVHDFSLYTMRETTFPQEAKVRKVSPRPVLARVPAVFSGADCADPPWLVQKISYYARSECTVFDVGAADPITLRIDGDKSGKPVVLTGRAARTIYSPIDPSDNDGSRLARRVTPGVGVRNFAAAFKAAGYKETGTAGNGYWAYAHAPDASGDFWLLYAPSGTGDDGLSGYWLMTLQVSPPKTCTTEIYGVNFDFDKATIKPDSEPALQKMKALFDSDKDYKAEIGGHTDNVGDRNYNRKLSGRRAEAVKNWLTAHGVAAARLSSQGYGDAMPLVPNDTADHRARNRRVELKGERCSSGAR
jgi:outer membrane protein OmpA-like peptidoglycan-associated protein